MPSHKVPRPVSLQRKLSFGREVGTGGEGGSFAARRPTPRGHSRTAAWRTGTDPKSQPLRLLPTAQRPRSPSGPSPPPIADRVAGPNVTAAPSSVERKASSVWAYDPVARSHRGSVVCLGIRPRPLSIRPRPLSIRPRPLSIRSRPLGINIRPWP